METLQKELEILQRQKAASEQAALNAKQRQSSGGVWGWLAGTPGDQKSDDAWSIEKNLNLHKYSDLPLFGSHSSPFFCFLQICYNFYFLGRL